MFTSQSESVTSGVYECVSLRVAEQHSFVVLSGNSLTLPCGNVSQPQSSCSGTSWTKKYRRSTRDTTPSVKPPGPPSPNQDLGGDLVRSGSVQPGHQSHRLNLTESCELQIEEVQRKDAGVYECTQLNQSQSFVFFLSVAYMFGRSAGYSTTMSCGVTPHEFSDCGFTVRFLHSLDPNQTRWTVKTSQCSAEIDVSMLGLPRVSCEVTDLNHNQVYVFPKITDSLPVVTLLMLVIHSVELLMVSVVMVILLTDKFTEKASVLSVYEVVLLGSRKRKHNMSTTLHILVLLVSLHSSGAESFLVPQDEDVVRFGLVRPSLSQRLSLTESCDLHIKNVEPKDAGVYVCTQLNQSQPSNVSQSQSSKSFLSVAYNEEFQLNQTLFQTENKPEEPHGAVKLYG
ncbi:hypothetical protein WMY93_025514 [Mugilogobius chulae]|uniref:Ig-like domain-containing protein n=1 Tax=Mugilogobius chulae TaxID=88201 RepID=A0AAW0MZ41_9GOBI